MTLAVISGRALWYLTRGSGVVALILLTGALVMGVVCVERFRSDRWPRFALSALHRNLSLLALAVVVIHVVTTVLDGYAPITLLDGVIPFNSPYRDVWLGLGALSFDVMLAVTLTSLIRGRLGHRTWRAVHWASYASWPIALVHALGTGTDTPVWWSLVLSAVCLLAVLGAVAIRILSGWPANLRVRAAAGVALVVGPLALLAWLPGGPLGTNWARRAGTPVKLIGHATRTPVTGTATAPLTSTQTP
jgi:sulfoxide reductase heme-binding subunit YedZ